MSHIRKKIHYAKQYEDDVEFELYCKAQEVISNERIRKAYIRAKVIELANSPEWINTIKPPNNFTKEEQN